MDYTEKIQQLLHGIRYASMATVNENGSPHCSPLVFMYDKNLRFVYWGSHPDSQHSQNVLRTGEAFFSAYNSQTGGTGLYLQTAYGKIVEGDELVTALQIHNHFRALYGKNPLDIAYYQGGSPQKMWRAEVQKIWINGTERRADGRLTKDYKIEILPTEISNIY